MTARALILSAPEHSDELRRWGLAAAIVIAAHIGLMTSYILVWDSEPDGASSAPAVIVDLAPEAAAPPSQFDLAPGPDVNEAQPVNETPKPDPQQDAIPKIEAPADVMLPLHENAKKQDDKPVEKTPPSPQTTAAPRSDAQIAPKPRAPSPGSAESRAAVARWRDLVLARLQSVKRYPNGEDREGTASVTFSVDHNGRVLSRHLARSSGVSSLDREVVEMIQRAQPFPSFPAAMAQSVVSLTVPVRFSRR